MIPEANGSSFMECGNSKVICSVYGPKEVSSKSSFSDSAQVSVDFRQTTFCGPKRKPFMPQPEDKEIGQRILNAIEPGENERKNFLKCIYHFPYT